MRQLLAVPLFVGALSFVGCQQSQEADDDADGGTTVIEKETTVEEPAGEPDVNMDVEMKTGEGGAAGEVNVEGGTQ